MERIIKKITEYKMAGNLFSNPVFAALSIGLVIHLLQQLNSILFLKTSYISKIIDEFSISITSAFIHIVVPFFIPYIISTFGKIMTEIIQQESLMKYPESNPNIIMKIDKTGVVCFMNKSGRKYCQKLDIDPDECEKILPDDYINIFRNLIRKDSEISVERVIKDIVFNFKFSSFLNEDTVFVTGMDITKQKRLEKSVAYANLKMTEIMEFFDESVELYKNRSSNIDIQNHKMMDLLLKNDENDVPDKADYIFLTRKSETSLLEGYIYWKEIGKLKKSSNSINIDSRVDRVAISNGAERGIFSFWSDKFDNINDYQSLFHKDVRAIIGVVSGYVTYHSGNVALIAFYKQKKVDKNDLNILKSLATYSNSLGILKDKTIEVEKAFIYTVESLARAAEANDEDTGDHILRVNEYSKVLSEALGMDSEFIMTIHYSAQMHDVGKIHVHPDILKKPGKLTDDEFMKMKSHALFGKKILGDSPKLKMAREIAESHHEKWDGSGYPMGLKGKNIPLSGRIVNLADIYDALRQKRVYKPSFSHRKTFEIITEGDGRVNPSGFDPKLLSTFRKIHNKFDDIFEKYHPDKS